jgi:hypothetical protein
VAAGDECLLVGRRDDLAGPQGGEHGPKADDSARPHDDEVDVIARRQGFEGVGAGNTVRAVWQIKTGEGPFVRRCDDWWPEPGRLFGQQGRIGAGRERDDFEGVSVAFEDVERLSPDRTGRAQKRDPSAAT